MFTCLAAVLQSYASTKGGIPTMFSAFRSSYSSFIRMKFNHTCLDGLEGLGLFFLSKLLYISRVDTLSCKNWRKLETEVELATFHRPVLSNAC